MNNYWNLTHSQRFASKVEFRNVELRTAADVVQFSFIVQTSISGLDLELCQSYQVNNHPLIRNNYPSLSYSKGFISSEEKCRKVLATSRNLLYALHLDLPKGRDWSLKNSSQPKDLSYYCRIPHIAKICIGDEFYINILYKIIDYACENTHHNLKVLKWFIKFNGLKNFQFRELPDNILNHFIDCVHPGISDTDFVRECFKKLDFKNWVDSSEKPGRVANLLYQVRRLGKKLDDIVFWSYDFPHRCLLHHSFVYVSDVFMFMNEPTFCESFLLGKIYSIR
ncbi:hypothetical protein AVEN_221075-1 [Araneus ventricosus]|uniref:SOCS box domain-containing protein n=1 Tax=Araneus ventricosus TaxID=182803 RepID=A0A4Y2QZI8_ARAVE|nr:hypothetical protein AVEN_221075-1 [Araneus ventricosus]